MHFWPDRHLHTCTQMHVSTHMRWRCFRLQWSNMTQWSVIHHETTQWTELKAPRSWKQILCRWTLLLLGRRRRVYMWSGSSSVPDFLSLLPKTFQILKQSLVESWASGPKSQFSPHILTKWFYKYFLVLGSFKQVFSYHSWWLIVLEGCNNVSTAF